MNEEKKCVSREFTKGLLAENPVFRLVLGTCPTLAVSTSVASAIGMGLAATIVLTCSNIVISALRKLIPDRVRIPAFGPSSKRLLLRRIPAGADRGNPIP